MSERNSGLRAALRAPSIYAAAQLAVGAARARRVLVDEFLALPSGVRILDVGCGPGVLTAMLPAPASYLGVDLNPAYVSAARARYSEPFRFELGDAADLKLPAATEYDVVVVVGLLHHLDDEAVRRLVEVSARHLAPAGRLVALENAWVPGQHWMAQRLIAADRGTSVRTVEGYRALLEPHFAEIRMTIRHDLLRLPYTHVIADCARPERPQ